MSKLLMIDRDLLRIIHPGITDRELEIEYDIYNGITISQKAKNRFPIREEEIDELIEKQSLIKILYAMDGNAILNNLNVSENVMSYLEELSKPMKKIRVKKIEIVKNQDSDNIQKNMSKYHKSSLYSLVNRKKLRAICHYIVSHPNDEKSKKIMTLLEEKGKSL